MTWVIAPRSLESNVVSGVVSGFAVIFVIIGIGFVLGRTGTLGPDGQIVLSRLVFFVATPALLFDVLATSDLAVIFSPPCTWPLRPRSPWRRCTA